MELYIRLLGLLFILSSLVAANAFTPPSPRRCYTTSTRSLSGRQWPIPLERLIADPLSKTKALPGGQHDKPTFASSREFIDDEQHVEICSDNSGEQVEIRCVKYEELYKVAELITEGLGHDKTSMIHKPRAMVELMRLQMNFPYDRSRHLMLVALADSNQETLSGGYGKKDHGKKYIAGFVDIDARTYEDQTNIKLPENFPPRPYLSDLFVSSRVHRRGIGTLLVCLCEEICKHAWDYNMINLRVDKTNTGALRFYDAIGFGKDEAQLELEKTEKKIGFHLTAQIQLTKSFEQKHEMIK